MNHQVLTPLDILAATSRRATDQPVGLLVVRDVVLETQYGSAYDRHTGQIIAPSVVRRGPSLRLDRRINPTLNLTREQLATVPPARPDTAAILLPLPFQGANHFGHLITEVVGMLYPILREQRLIGEATPVIVGSRAWKKSSLHQATLVKLLKPTVANPRKPLLSFSRLWLPFPTLYLRHSFSSLHRCALRHLLPLLFGYDEALLTPLPVVNQEKKIYLSRSMLSDKQRRIVNEDKLQERLASRGWTIIHLERYPMADQIRLLSEARLVAGTVGSAFHLLPYLDEENISKKTILMLSPGKERFFNYAHQFAALSASAWCMIALSRNPSRPKDLVLRQDDVARVIEWFDSF
jgi:hypothetical protein